MCLCVCVCVCDRRFESCLDPCNILLCIPLQEFKAQCFGGEFTGEVYDHVLKK